MLEKIAGGGYAAYCYQRQAETIKEPNYFIRLVKEPGSNTLLMNYIESRGVGRAAAGRLKEVYYDVAFDNKQLKHFCPWLAERTGHLGNPGAELSGNFRAKGHQLYPKQ